MEFLARTTDGPGQVMDSIGLGLALVKRIVEADHARVDVETQAGQGSTVSFELPLARRAAA